MNDQQSHKLPLKVECACGCGMRFKPKYDWHIYYETRCRVNGWMKRQVNKAEKKELSEVKDRMEKIEKKLGIK